MPTLKGKHFPYTKQGIEAFRKAKKKAIDVTSDVLSAPARFRSQRAQSRSKADRDILRLDRETKNVSLQGKDYNDPIFRNRMNAIGVRDRLEKKSK